MSLAARKMRMGARIKPTTPGQRFLGGYYIGELAGYYHVLAPKSSEANLNWLWGTQTYPPIASFSTWDSTANTDLILVYQGPNTTTPAALHCRAYGADWDLPARDVALLMVQNLDPTNPDTHPDFQEGGPQALNVLASQRYWTSNQDESSYQRANIVSLNYYGIPEISATNKTSTANVRPVKRIPA